MKIIIIIAIIIIIIIIIKWPLLSYSFHQILFGLLPAFHAELSQPVGKPSQITELCAIPMTQKISNRGNTDWKLNNTRKKWINTEKFLHFFFLIFHSHYNIHLLLAVVVFFHFAGKCLVIKKRSFTEEVFQAHHLGPVMPIKITPKCTHEHLHFLF